jgi:hypothetical protein
MAGFISSGVVFSAGDGAEPTEVFATVAQVQEVKWSGYSRSVVDSRVLGDLYPTRMVGPHEVQNVEMKLLFDPGETAHESIRTRLIAGTRAQLPHHAP